LSSDGPGQAANEGRLIPAGDHHVRLYEEGAGSSAVVIIAGAGDWADSWVPIRHRLAAAHCIISYDRAAIGAVVDTSVGPREQRLWPEHAAFMDTLFERGSIVLAGPLADNSGALVIVQAASTDEVRNWFRSDPWSVNDILPIREVREWAIFLDGRTCTQT
jgi:uncharacterized protein